MNDDFGRNINYLRISVTDRCNLRCCYCMPEEGTDLFSHDEMLTFEEILRICRCVATLGISRIKLTGGEPLVRKNLVWLAGQIGIIPGIEDVTVTTNGILLDELAAPLKKAGVSCVNISLDTLDPVRYLTITRRDEFEAAQRGIDAAKAAGLNCKINCAVMEDFRREEVSRFAAFSIEHQIPVRFIEMMPIGQGRSFQALKNDDLLQELKNIYLDVAPLPVCMGNGPATYYSFAGGTGCVGFISAVHHRFCGECNRIRLTSDGFLKLCLASESGVPLRDIMRAGIEEADFTALVEHAVKGKPDGHAFGMETNQEIQTNMNRIGG